MINFEHIKIEGFGSIVKPIKFKLNQEGLNVLRGKVGSGKTSIPSALCWALYGKTLKDKSQVETWVDIRPDYYRGTNVKVSIDIGGTNWEIVRCLNYKSKIKGTKGNNNLFIFEDGEPYTIAKGKKQQQDFIEKLLGYSFNLFKSSIIFGQKMKRIIEETGPDKKKIFEEAFDINFIEEAKDNATIELRKIKETIVSINNSLENKADSLENAKESYDDAKKYEKDFKRDKEKILEDYNNSIDTIESKLSDPPAKAKNTNKLKKAISLLNTKAFNASSIWVKKQTLLNSIKTSKKEQKAKEKLIRKKPKNCKTCLQILSKNSYERMKRNAEIELEAILIKIEKETREADKIVTEVLSITNDKIKKKQKKLDKVNAHNKDVEFDSKERERLNKELDEWVEKRDTLEKKKLKSKSTKYKKKKKKLEKAIGTLKKQLIDINTSKDTQEWLIKEPLGNAGLKAYMFNSLIGDINIKLEEYSKTLGFQVEFGIDLDSHRKDFYQLIYYDGIIIPYEDLSGGQKQLVDTSIAFAIHDVISNIKPTNLVFLDEPFESLGMDEVELIEELVENKSKGKCLFLITHHQAFSPVQANDIFVTRNKKKFTKIS